MESYRSHQVGFWYGNADGAVDLRPLLSGQVQNAGGGNTVRENRLTNTGVNGTTAVATTLSQTVSFTVDDTKEDTAEYIALVDNPIGFFVFEEKDSMRGFGIPVAVVSRTLTNPISGRNTHAFSLMQRTGTPTEGNLYPCEGLLQTGDTLAVASGAVGYIVDPDNSIEYVTAADSTAGDLFGVSGARLIAEGLSV